MILVITAVVRSTWWPARHVLVRCSINSRETYVIVSSANIAPWAGLFSYTNHQTKIHKKVKDMADLDEPAIWSAVIGLYTTSNGWFCLLDEAYPWSWAINPSRRVLSVAIAAVNIIQSRVAYSVLWSLAISNDIPVLEMEGALLSSGRPNCFETKEERKKLISLYNLPNSECNGPSLDL